MVTDGPPTIDWMRLPHRPFINLEPPYEGHVAYQSKKPITADATRRALYWSLPGYPQGRSHLRWPWSLGMGRWQETRPRTIRAPARL